MRAERRKDFDGGWPEGVGDEIGRWASLNEKLGEGRQRRGQHRDGGVGGVLGFQPGLPKFITWLFGKNYIK